MLILILLSLLLSGSPVPPTGDTQTKNPPVLVLTNQHNEAEDECCGPDPIPPGQVTNNGNHYGQR